MITRVKILKSLCLIAFAVAVNGCGGGGGGFFTSEPSVGQSGKAVMGPVRDATIFADKVVGGTPFVQDADEVWTKTNENGDFTLPSVPGYGYRLVSKGGIDKLTGQPAMQMIAPAGSKNVTPVTTLVALDLTGTVKAKLEALMPAGSGYDTDISVTSSTAILMVVKSVEATTQSMISAVNTAAGAQAISAQQMASTQALIMQSVAAEMAKPTVTSATLTTTASLSATMQTAASAATVDINNDGGNITIPSATAAALATTAVSASATALNVGAAANTASIPGGEAAVITPDVAVALVNTVTNASSTAAVTITATETPSDYTPPPISTTGATGGTSGGTGSGF